MSSVVKKPSQATAKLSKVLNGQVNETASGSLIYIKQLTIVAVSTITNLRNAFSRNDYAIDRFAGMDITTLKEQCEDERAHFLISGLSAAFEALEKKYLHQLAVCFYESEGPETLIEYHIFEYSYSGAGGSMSVRTGGRGGTDSDITLDNIRDRTIKLLRACDVSSSSPALPETYDISVRLNYNDAAPVGYQAPGFSPTTSTLSALDGRELGWVGTRFHTVHVRSHFRDIIVEQRADEELLEMAVTRNELVPTNEEVVPSSNEQSSVRCECGRADMLDDSAMMICRFCGTVQHAICYGVLGTGPHEHCCVPCAERAPDCRSTDPGLTGTSKRKSYAMFRRVLLWLRSAGPAVSVASLSAAMALNRSTAHKAMRELFRQGVLATMPKLPDTDVELVPDELEKAMGIYFRPLSPDVGTRLIEESQHSQRSDVSEPDTFVLSPKEGVSLQATGSTVVLSNTENERVAKPVRQDSTLDQYRTALAPLNNNNSPAAILKTPRKRTQNGEQTCQRTKRVRKASKH